MAGEPESVDVTINRVLDGYPLLYLLATNPQATVMGPDLSTKVLIETELEECDEPLVTETIGCLARLKGGEAFEAHFWRVNGDLFIRRESDGVTFRMANPCPTSIGYDFGTPQGDETVTLVRNSHIWEDAVADVHREVPGHVDGV